MRGNRFLGSGALASSEPVAAEPGGRRRAGRGRRRVGESAGACRAACGDAASAVASARRQHGGEGDLRQTARRRATIASRQPQCQAAKLAARANVVERKCATAQADRDR